MSLFSFVSIQLHPWILPQLGIIDVNDDQKLIYIFKVALISIGAAEVLHKILSLHLKNNRLLALDLIAWSVINCLPVVLLIIASMSLIVALSIKRCDHKVQNHRSKEMFLKEERKRRITKTIVALSVVSLMWYPFPIIFMLQEDILKRNKKEKTLEHGLKDFLTIVLQSISLYIFYNLSPRFRVLLRIKGVPVQFDAVDEFVTKCHNYDIDSLDSRLSVQPVTSSSTMKHSLPADSTRTPDIEVTNQA